ncbi:uncharacterized protein LOC115023694 [Cottoperca gobio]|uniref:Uncharacterized protein LOC115023694 n=1 Tax=Cottoperca gobio TaxID=56716 RepID=A0A6J2RLB2_COTGO|nr:uncharacterized protein LOC115023694 [Cottoperca gobio]XP_029310760.1 uncharacterized protein LOC115023694 [Cottoperca gobio]
MAVVVGERSQVKARLMAVEDLLVKRGSRFSGKETSIRRLGVAKFRLLWKKIEQGLQQDFPEVKFVQGAAGQLVLEGSAKEILKAGAWISDQEKFVFERTVSDMSPHFLAFLRKAYGGPGVLGDFLGVSDKVEVELRDIELCFFTLSSNNLDETEKALQAEIKEVKIDVPSCSVVPSELQEKLKSKTNEMNQRQYRAQVVFGSDSTVCLLGHTKEVEDLNEAVIQFILDHSSAQSIVHLPFKELPELPNSFFLRERVPVEPLGAEQYCRSPTEKDELLSVDQLLQGISTGNSTPGDHGFQMDATAQDKARGATAGAPGGGVHVKIIQGRVETQQVDALVSPMAGHDPLSTSVGNTLFKIVGSQLTAMFRKEAVEETWPGNTVLVEGLPELPSNAVFFLNLTPWDDDHDGTAVEVLKLGVNNILTSCEKRGFSSVALPVLGAGIRLRFPNSVVARVVLEEVHKFEQNRASRTPFLVSIVIHPDDEESSEAFKSARESSQLKGFTMDVHQVDQVSNTKRIILLGKTGCGKSNLANTMFGEKLFSTNHSPNSGTSKCQAETKCINGRSITLIDTPGFFDVGRSEQEMKPEIVRCITECAPGPHAFLIVLKVEKFTEQEKAVISKICQYFSEDALKYAVVVFTHGNQLPKGMTIEKFVSLNENLSDLVKKCGGRCHVVDNKYWKNKEKNYRSNQVQVEDLLDTIEKMVMENNGDIYTNKVFQEVEKQIRMAEERIKQNTSSGNMPLGEIRKQAKTIVSEKFLNQLVGTAVGALLGSFFGVAAMVRLVLIALKNNGGLMNVMKVIKVSNLGGGATVAGGEVAGLTVAGVVLGVVTTGIVAGGVMGGVIGYEAAEGSGSPMEATERAFDAVMHQGKAQLHKLP